MPIPTTDIIVLNPSSPNSSHTIVFENWERVCQGEAFIFQLGAIYMYILMLFTLDVTCLLLVTSPSWGLASQLQETAPPISGISRTPFAPTRDSMLTPHCTYLNTLSTTPSALLLPDRIHAVQNEIFSSSFAWLFSVVEPQSVPKVFLNFGNVPMMQFILHHMTPTNCLFLWCKYVLPRSLVS